MIGALARKIFGSSNERRIKSYMPRVDEINALEKELEALSDTALRARTDEFKKQVADGKSLDDILVPAFATCREASKWLRFCNWNHHALTLRSMTRMCWGREVAAAIRTRSSLRTTQPI